MTTQAQEIRVEDFELASSPVISHPMQRNEILDEVLDVSEHAAATVIPAVDKTAEEIDFDQINAGALSKLKNYKVHMGSIMT